MKNSLPDFCVSRKANGFDEFLKVYSEYFRYDYEGFSLFYGMKDNDAYDDNETWTTNIITPFEAIALLTAKPLTDVYLIENINGYDYLLSKEEIKEGDWFIANQAPFKCLEVVGGDYPYKVSNQFNNNEIAFHSKHWLKIIATNNPELIAYGIKKLLHTTQEESELPQARKHESKIIKELLDEIDSDSTQQESVKDTDVDPQIMHEILTDFGCPQVLPYDENVTMQYSDLMNAMNVYKNQQTAHLQQQLDEAKEKIAKLEGIKKVKHKCIVCGHLNCICKKPLI